MQIATKKENNVQNGIEIYFTVYPLTGTKEVLKKNGFRWNRKKSCWYAKMNNDTDAVASAIADTTLDEYEEIASASGEPVKMVNADTKQTEDRKATPDVINLDNLGENNPGYYSSDLARAIREDLKKRGVKGVSVKQKRGGYTANITITVKATTTDFVSIEEAKKRYPFSMFGFDNDTNRGFYNGSEWVYNYNNLSDGEKQVEYDKYIRYEVNKPSINIYHLVEDRDRYWNFTTAFFNKLCAIYRIANQWNYNNSDSMTDYFDVGYYLDIDIKTPVDFTPRKNMTDDEIMAYNEEIRLKEEKEAAEMARMEAERIAQEEEYKRSEAQRILDRKAIEADITVIDLEKPDYIYVTRLVGGYGKDSTLDEFVENLRVENDRDAVITRKVIFHSKEAFDVFGRYLIDDFDFLEGKGGAATEDIRLDCVENIYNLNKKQNESIKWYMNNCVGIYFNDELRLVSNPEGYGYSRYTYLLSEESGIKQAQPELERQKK